MSSNSKKISKYSEEFKQEALKLLETTQLSVPEVAKSLGMSEKTLYAWRKAKRQKLSNPHNQPPELEALQAQLLKAQKEIQLLKKENEILEKATAFFAKKSS